MNARHCVHCGNTFYPAPVNPDEEFCSEWCRKAHDREESTVVIETGNFGDRRLVEVSLRNVVIGGSPALAIDGVPVLWYERWIADSSYDRYLRTMPDSVRVAHRRGGQV